MTLIKFELIGVIGLSLMVGQFIGYAIAVIYLHKNGMLNES